MTEESNKMHRFKTR